MEGLSRSQNQIKPENTVPRPSSQPFSSTKSDTDDSKEDSDVTRQQLLPLECRREEVTNLGEFSKT